MSINILDHDQIAGLESLSVGERLSRFFAELSLGIDKFNAKHLNKSIHTVNVGNLFSVLKTKNNYFDVSYKHIASPVLFNNRLCTFEEFVDLNLQGIGAMKVVMTQAEDVYRGLKTTAAKGQVPATLISFETVALITELKGHTDLAFSAGNPATRPVSEMYPSWSVANSLFQRFNKDVATLKHRDAEVLAKQIEQVIEVAKLVKRKIASSEIMLNETQLNVLDETLGNLNLNVNYIGLLLNNISELTRLFEIHVDQLAKLEK